MCFILGSEKCVCRELIALVLFSKYTTNFSYRHISNFAQIKFLGPSVSSSEVMEPVSQKILRKQTNKKIKCSPRLAQGKKRGRLIAKIRHPVAGSHRGPRNRVRGIRLLFRNRTRFSLSPGLCCPLAAAPWSWARPAPGPLCIPRSRASGEEGWAEPSVTGCVSIAEPLRGGGRAVGASRRGASPGQGMTASVTPRRVRRRPASSAPGPQCGLPILPSFPPF